jgi:hypothetical protein
VIQERQRYLVFEDHAARDFIVGDLAKGAGHRISILSEPPAVAGGPADFGMRISEFGLIG